MSKFKVGDRVRVNDTHRRNNNVDDRPGSVGDVLTVTKLDGNTIHVGDSKKYWSCERFELVEEKAFITNEINAYTRKHGVTKVRLTEKHRSIPKDTILYVAAYDNNISTWDDDTYDKNKQFEFEFDYQHLFSDYYSGFVLMDGVADDEVMDSPEIVSPKEKLIETNMDTEDIKTFPNAVLVAAEKEAKKELADDQMKIATAKFKELHVQIANAEIEVIKAQKKLDDLRGKAAIVKPKK